MNERPSTLTNRSGASLHDLVVNAGSRPEVPADSVSGQMVISSGGQAIRMMPLRPQANPALALPFSSIGAQILSWQHPESKEQSPHDR
jgi:hypothetical protein